MKNKVNLPKAFIGFLFASLFFWLLLNLSKEYTTEVQLPLYFDGLAQNKVIRNTPQQQINLVVKGSGFKLISSSLSPKKIKLDLKSLRSKTSNEYYLLSRNNKNLIQKQLRSGITLVAMPQDTIFFDIDKLETKKVPIQPNINIRYKKGFDLAKPVFLKPDSISLSGTKKSLSTIEYILTKKLELVDVSENVTKHLNLEIPEKINANHNKTVLNLFIDRFTEGKVEIPITVINIPKGDNITIYPKKATITFKVGLKNFQNINANSFEIICDLKDTRANNLTYMTPKIIVKTDAVSSVKVIPNKIDFLIQK